MGVCGQLAGRGLKRISYLGIRILQIDANAMEQVTRILNKIFHITTQGLRKFDQLTAYSLTAYVSL